MAARGVVIAQMDVARRELRGIVEQVGGKEANERLVNMTSESRDPLYQQMRELQIFADVFSEALSSGTFREETDIAVLKGVSNEVLDSLRERGYETKADLRSASNEELMKIPGVGGATVRQIRKQL